MKIVFMLLAMVYAFNCANLQKEKIEENINVSPMPKLVGLTHPKYRTPKEPKPVLTPCVGNCHVDKVNDVHINMTPLVKKGGKYEGPELVKLNPRRSIPHPVRRFVIVEEKVKPANCS